MTDLNWIRAKATDSQLIAILRQRDEALVLVAEGRARELDLEWRLAVALKKIEELEDEKG